MPVRSSCSRFRSFLLILTVAGFCASLFACGGGPSSSTTTLTGPPPLGTLGSVTKEQSVTCDSVGASGGTTNASCYELLISCPEVADQNMTLKVNQPTGASKGTVLFTIGGGASGWYDTRFTYGTSEINTVIQAGFTTVQMNWSIEPTGFPSGGTFAGWMTGPGGALRLACRWATAAKWVHDNANISAPSEAFCATGNSGGSGAAAYAVAHYGLDPMFDMLEETSGPPYTRIDKGCICDPSYALNTPCGQGVVSECYLGDAQMFIDPSYNPLGDECSGAEKTHSTTNQTTFLDDSIMGSNPKLSYPNTYVHFLFGGQDNTSAVPLALEWQTQLTGKNAPTPGSAPIDCVADAPHDMPQVQDASQTIANDLIANCHR